MVADHSSLALRFQSLGNILSSPAAGLLFVDWATGTTLQVTGQARVDYSPDSHSLPRGVERRVLLAVDAWVYVSFWVHLLMPLTAVT
jgi:hypothetical protein